MTIALQVWQDIRGRICSRDAERPHLGTQIFERETRPEAEEQSGSRAAGEYDDGDDGEIKSRMGAKLGACRG
jgi:hypothetical protein